VTEQIDCPELLTNREVEQLRANIIHLLRNVAESAFCKGCHQQVWWLIHRNGKRTPYDCDAKPHFATCSEREQFKKKGA
jgi:hypothetical protein